MQIELSTIRPIRIGERDGVPYAIYDLPSYSLFTYNADSALSGGVVFARRIEVMSIFSDVMINGSYSSGNRIRRLSGVIVTPYNSLGLPVPKAVKFIQGKASIVTVLNKLKYQLTLSEN